MVDLVQRISVYANKLRVEEVRVKKIAVVDGQDNRSEKDLIKAVLDAFSDHTINKVVLMRSYVSEHESN